MTEQGDKEYTKIYIIEQNNSVDGLHGIQGIYNNYNVANTVFQSLSRFRTFKTFKTFNKSLNYVSSNDINLKIIKSIESSPNGYISYTLIEIVL